MYSWCSTLKWECWRNCNCGLECCWGNILGCRGHLWPALVQTDLGSPFSSQTGVRPRDYCNTVPASLSCTGTSQACVGKGGWEREDGGWGRRGVVGDEIAGEMRDKHNPGTVSTPPAYSRETQDTLWPTSQEGERVVMHRSPLLNEWFQKWVNCESLPLIVSNDPHTTAIQLWLMKCSSYFLLHTTNSDTGYFTSASGY